LFPSENLIDYDYIENAFREVISNLERTTEGHQFYYELIELAKKISNFKAFVVLGGSYQERMMTTKSDLDFWIMLDGKEDFTIPKRKFNRLFRNGIVKPVFEIIARKYPNIEPCGSSVRVFREFTEGIFNKPKERWKKRISSGLKIISFGKVVNVNRDPFASKSGYVELRRRFKQFWKTHGIDIWDVWGDLTQKLEGTLSNIKRYKGKTLYRILQLSIQQISDAYGLPERYPHTLSLQEKLFKWTGREKFVKKQLKDLIQIIESMRRDNVRVSQLSEDKSNKLKTQLILFTENLYKPFRKWFKIMASMLNVFEIKNVGIKYFGISKTHGYIIFSSQKNPFSPIRGIDIEEKSSAKVSFLANIGKTDRNVINLLERKGFKILHEVRNAEGEVVHHPGFKSRVRIHIHLGDYDKNDILTESELIISDLSKKLTDLRSFLT
jgi:hypothetical protein